MSATTITRKQAESLAVARGIARGLPPRRIAAEYSIHPAAAVHHGRRLRHLRVTAEEVNNLLAAVGPESADEYLLAMFARKRAEHKQRTKAARRTKGGAA